MTLGTAAVDATTVTVDQDPGDEDDSASAGRWLRGMRVGGVSVFYPRHWFEERARTLPDHDGGDEDPWMPLSELSRRRLARSLL